jgi:hypothetical protein
MKIAVVGIDQGTFTYTRENVGSGYENIALALNVPWHNTYDVWSQDFDAVLSMGTTTSIKAIVERGGKPAGWRKLVILQEAGSSVLNTPWYARLLQATNFDAFAVYSRPLLPQMEVLGKPVFFFIAPYPFHLFPELKHTKKDPNKVAIYLTRYHDPAGNFLANLALLKRLPENIVAHCHFPRGDWEPLLTIVNAAGLGHRLELHDAVPWQQYIKEVADCSLFLTMDNRHTWGRFDLDAAMVGCKSIGAYSASKAILFPEYMVEPNDVDCAAELALNELQHPELFMPTPAQYGVFSHESVRRNLLVALEKL